MITAVVQFKLPEGVSLEDATARFQSTAPHYLGHGGLTRKYYLFDEVSGTGGGCYLFENRAEAEAMFDDVWRDRIKETYGADPLIQFFETPVIVDNVQGEIIGGS
ncbi:MAG: YdhR family protein [Alphaproteobacteria bacterium]